MKINKQLLKKTVHNPQTWLWILFGLSALYLVSFLVFLCIVALYNGTHMSTYAADGTFQLYDPMRRLNLGQALGYDFPVFHGIGIPLLHYPLFVLLGSGVFAAETAKWIVSPLLFLSSASILFYALFRDYKKTTIAVALLTLLSLQWVDVLWPGNSLIGARETFAIFVIGALLWKTSRLVRIKDITVPLNEFIALILMGCAPLFGSEQGVAAILAYAVVGFAIIFRGDRKHLIRDIAYLAAKGAFILAVMFIAYAILTKGHPLSAIAYAFIDIPSDQGWYFGTELTGYLTWGNLLPYLFSPRLVYVWAVILVGAACLFGIFKTKKLQHLRFPLGYACAYGMTAFFITIWGYYSPGSQLIPLERVMSLIAVAMLVMLLFSKQAWNWRAHRNVKIIAISAIILISAFFLGQSSVLKFMSLHNDFSIKEVFQTARLARHSDDYFAASPGWKESIDTFRPYINPNKSLWDMYTSVYDTVYGNHLNPSSGGEDYIIHALGDKRRAAYEADFLKMKPHYVLTLKPSYFIFEEWLWHNHWGIYKDLFTHYKVVAENASNYLWEIKPTDAMPDTPTTLAHTTDNTITLPENKTTQPLVYSVTVNYTARSVVPFTNKVSRYFIKVNTHQLTQRYQIALPSQKTSWSFPVIVLPGEDTVTLSGFADGIVPFASLKFTSASYSKVSIDAANMKPIEDDVKSFQNYPGGFWKFIQSQR